MARAPEEAAGPRDAPEGKRERERCWFLGCHPWCQRNPCCTERPKILGWGVVPQEFSLGAWGWERDLNISGLVRRREEGDV